MGSSRRVQFTRAALRQANIRDNKGPSRGKIQVTSSHQRSPFAQEETERQERCARRDVWRLANNIYKLKEKEKVTFFSPTDESILPAASTIKLEEREFVVDAGAIMHTVSRQEPNSAELETMRVSESPMMVVAGYGEVLTKEEATAYVRELDLFVTVMLIDDTPAVLSFGKHCEDHGYNYYWTSGQTPHLIKNGRKIDFNTANYVPFVVPGLSTRSSSSSSPTSLTSTSQKIVAPTEHPASTRSESMSAELQGQLIVAWTSRNRKLKKRRQRGSTRKLVA